MSSLMFQCLSAGEVLNNVNMIDLNDLSWLIDQNLKEINRKINRIQGQEGTANGVAAINEEQKQPLSMDDIINGGGGHEVQPFGDAANPQNDYQPAPFNP